MGSQFLLLADRAKQTIQSNTFVYLALVNLFNEAYTGKNLQEKTSFLGEKEENNFKLLCMVSLSVSFILLLTAFLNASCANLAKWLLPIWLIQ